MNSFSNLTEKRPTFVTHLECSATGERYPADQAAGLSEAGMPLLVRYDLEALSASLNRETLNSRTQDMWRYREFLPVRHNENIVSLGEQMPLWSGSIERPLRSAPRRSWSRMRGASPPDRSKPGA